MLLIVRAAREHMNEVRACINSNFHLYKDIVDNPHDLNEHHVDAAWAERNFKIREFYLARLDGTYVGAGSYQNLGDFAYVGYFYVKAGHQRQGIGRALMHFLETRTLMDELRDLRLFCHPDSSWARAFYERLGFGLLSGDKQEILAMDDGVMRPYYEQRALLFQKALEPPPEALEVSPAAVIDPALWKKFQES